MTLRKPQIWTINVALSIAIITMILLFQGPLLTIMGNFLLAIGHPMGYFHTDPVDALILGSIPIVSYLLYCQKTFISYKTIALGNLTMLISVLLACILAYVLAATLSKSPSPLFPDYVVFVPYPEFFWKVVLLIGLAVPLLFISIRRN
jgi:hypothetical protein